MLSSLVKGATACWDGIGADAGSGRKRTSIGAGMKTFNFGDNAYRRRLEPSVAGALSLVPGLGQLYNGERLKGWLFLEVGAINFAILLLIVCAESISNGLAQFAMAHHFNANYPLLKQLGSFKLGHPGATLLFALCLAFIAFAVRDAYDRATNINNREIYASQFLELSEATSGSYLAHFALMGALLLLSVFLLIPAPPRTQVTEIEFVSQDVQHRIKPPDTTRISKSEAVAQGHHRRELPVRTRQGETAPSAASSSRSAAHQTQVTRPQPRPELKTDQADAPKPAPVKISEAVKPPAPMTTPLPVVRPSAPAPAAVNPATPAPLPIRLQPSARIGPAPVPNSMRPVPSLNNASGFVPKPLIAANNIGSGAFAPPAIQSTNLSGGGSTSKASWMTGGGSQRGKTGSSQSAPSVDTSSVGGTAESNAKPTLADTSSKRSGNGKGDTAGEGPKPVGARSNPGKGVELAVLPPKLLTPVGDPNGGISNPDANSKAGRDQLNSTPKAPEFGAYMAELQRRIRTAWVPPKMPRSKSTIIVFTIGLNGELLSTQLQRSSGDHAMDDAAMQAIRNSAPFRHLPQYSPDSVDVQFTFDYNVFSGRSQF